MLSKSHGTMHGHDTGRQVVDLHRAEAARLEHALQGVLVRAHADRFGEIAMRLARVAHTSPSGATRVASAAARSPLPAATSSSRSPRRGRAQAMANAFQ